jgi:hypothetical protein
LFKKLPLIAAVGAVAVAVPATALSASHSNHSKKCNTHTVAYIAQGRYASSSRPLVSSGSWSGDLTIKLQSANHHFAKANNLKITKTAKGTNYTFTVSGAEAKFGKGVKSPANSHDHITVAGRVTEFSGTCTSTTPTIKINTISVGK